jgi:hypothetical protein
MPFLKQSTSQTIRFGPCLDKTDGVTEETALTLAQADMRLSKDGGAFAQKNAAGNATHDSDGWYSTTLDATDTATVGELILNVHQPANMLPVWMRWWVLEEAIYDSLFGASAAGFDSNQRVDVNAIASGGIASASFAAGAIDSTAIATDAITSTGLATSAANEIRDAVTGGAYALDTDANGRIRVVDGTGVGEINTASGAIVQVDQLGTQAKTDVNAEVADVLKTDTVTLPGQAAPPLAPTFEEMVSWLYKTLRNRTSQTSTQWSLYADNETTVDAKATVSDDGTTAIKQEIISGP